MRGRPLTLLGPWILGSLLALASPLGGAVVISELHYNPPQGADHEFLELHNTGPAPVDLDGWSFGAGVTFLFPPGSTLPAGGYRVVVGSLVAFRAAYPELPAEAILGEYAGSLSNDGETVSLLDASARLLDRVTYDDDSPWDFLADGFGASLERICDTASSSLPETWRASPVPHDPETTPGGSPGAANAIELCPPTAPARPGVRISEIHYHPVLEESLVESHEFIELHNLDAAPVSLASWRLAGGIDFTFPAGASIPAGGYVVIAKDRERLLEVDGYGLDPAGVYGNYERELDNGGEKVSLLGAEGQGIESVTYDDDAPWPVGADALGAGESWLAPELLPLEAHRYKGRSLERVSFEVDAGELANWAPSPLDGMTPGKPNASARPLPLPVVLKVSASPVGTGEALLRAGDEVRIEVEFTPAPPAGPVEVEFYLDPVLLGGAPERFRTGLYDDGVTGGDLAPEDGIFSALLPGQDENVVVRYRILVDFGGGPAVVSPRPSDPNGWNAYFVSPVIDTTTRVYQVLISPANWGKMWSNIQPGRASGCNANPNWGGEVPAIFIESGKVFDVQVRYQGSRWNRTNGPNINAWPYPKPVGGPSPLRALSWRIGFPRYDQHDGAGEVILNKLTQGCPGYNAGVGYRLFEAADVPGSRTQFIRFHVNGGYYHYMLELERPGEELIRRWQTDMARKYPDRPKEPGVGHLFKSQGYTGDEGPWGWGDERVLTPTCAYTKEDRYAATYDRKTNSWDTHAEFIRMIEELNIARRAGIPAIRAYFEEYFDLDLLMNYIAIINYAVPFDDMFQNHFLYQRLSDNKWIVFPWDLDQDFGEWKGAASSLYMGEQGDPDNRSGWWNYLKDAFLKAYREEYDDRLLLLNNTVLRPERVQALIDQVFAQANPTEAAAAPAGVSCGGAAAFQGRAASFRGFVLQRFNLINTRLAGITLDAGPDQTVFVGSVVQFDASASEPDPGDEVVYAWSNGMTGERPTFIFDTPGEHEVRLLVTLRGVEFSDSLVVTVLPRPELVHRESGGAVSIEAENFTGNERHDAVNVFWEPSSAQAGFSGSGVMLASELKRQSFLSSYAKTSPELRFGVHFEDAGTYRVWVRVFAPAIASDTCYVGLDGQERNTRFATQFAPDAALYVWSGDTRSSGPQLLEVPSPGLHIVSVWVRESGISIDKVYLTQDLEAAPTDLGPPESPRAPPPTGGGTPFIRGDADRSGRLSVNDGIAVILHLFGGVPIPCEDAADADDSGAVQLTDAVVILAHLFQRGPAPAPPYPAPGLDPTPDPYPCGGPEG